MTDPQATQAESRPRVLLADDHPLMLMGLKKLLEPACEVVGTVMDGRALLAAAERERPNLVITDISMPGIDGIAATRRLRELVPGLRVLILSFHSESSWVRSAFDAGACGYLVKSSAPEEIELAVREVLQDRFYVSPHVARAALLPVRESAPQEAAEVLTPREVDIVRLVGAGLGNKEIASRLGVAVTTVRTHLSSVYDKLQPASRVELALYAAQTAGATM
ncbi:MAG TPA: response regulator transcription factor [Thermoanaerobaculia bacterium]|nr:response regulator transcription factor [Thermoanaerobaculia bacterium]